MSKAAGGESGGKVACSFFKNSGSNALRPSGGEKDEPNYYLAQKKGIACYVNSFFCEINFFFVIFSSLIFSMPSLSLDDCLHLLKY